MSKAKDKLNLMIPPGTDAALCFIGEQYWLSYFDGERQGGKFLSPAAVRSAFRNETIDSGWLPVGVSRVGEGNRGKWMVRYLPPMHYALMITGRKRPLQLPMPALVWFGINHNYYIWAMKGNRLNPKDALYHAPVANVNSSGLICFGQNAHPDVAKGGFEQTWKTFWDAPFNDHQDGGKSKSHPKNINAKLIGLAKAKAKSYPEGDLMPAGFTLDAAIERLTNRKSQNDFWAYNEDFDEDDDE
jgi:PRTRC genetic system protein B